MISSKLGRGGVAAGVAIVVIAAVILSLIGPIPSLQGIIHQVVPSLP